MYKIANNSAPVYMTELVGNMENSRYNTRQSNRSFTLPSVKTHGRLSFPYNGIKAWNELPDHIKNSESKDIFKYKSKQYLFLDMHNQEDSIIYYLM